MQYEKERLEEYLKSAYSFESRAGWEAEELEIELIGTIQKKNRLYDIYVDTNKNYWYTTRIITKQGIVSEYEAVFGHQERRVQREEYIEASG